MHVVLHSRAHDKLNAIQYNSKKNKEFYKVTQSKYNELQVAGQLSDDRYMYISDLLRI